MRLFIIGLSTFAHAATATGIAMSDPLQPAMLRGSHDGVTNVETSDRSVRRNDRKRSARATAAAIADLRRRIEELEKEDDNGKEDENGNDKTKSGDADSDNGNDDKNDSEEKSLTYTPYFAGSVGYDTNPDEVEGGEGSVVQRYDTGMTITYDKNGTEIEFKLHGTFLDTAELEESNRWKYTLRADGETRVFDESGLLFGFERVHDSLLDPKTINNETYLGLRLTGDNTELELLGSIADEVNLTGDDEFGDAAPEEFDFIKASVRARLELNTKGKISPFVDARFANLNFPFQDIELLNRNADDYVLIGGAVFRPVKAVELSVGGRHNVRMLRDLIVPEVSNNFIDAHLTVKANDTLEFTASAERKLTEPDAESSLVADATIYELGFDWTPTDRLELKVAAARDRRQEIGEGEFEITKSVTGEIFYRFTDRLRFFTVLSKLWSDETFIDDVPVEYERLDARAGIETKF